MLHRDEFLTVLGTLHDVIARFLAASGVDKFFHHTADKLCLPPALLRRTFKFLQRTTLCRRFDALDIRGDALKTL
jgi:hypothetical protein